MLTLSVSQWKVNLRESSQNSPLDHTVFIETVVLAVCKGSLGLSGYNYVSKNVCSYHRQSFGNHKDNCDPMEQSDSPSPAVSTVLVGGPFSFAVEISEE